MKKTIEKGGNMKATRKETMKGKRGKDRLIFASDTDNIDQAIDWTERLTGHVGGFKFGFQFQQNMLVNILEAGTDIEAQLYALKMRKLYRLLKGEIFWDGKFDDIPNTVEGASMAVARLKALMFNFHCSCGKEAISRAVKAKGNLLALGVTVLTTTSTEECIEIFGNDNINKVLQFVGYLKDAGADGVICSAKEAVAIRANPEFEELILVTPGIRPAGSSAGDQKRVMTPAEAIRNGVDYVVIGRPISEAYDPVAAADAIAAEMDAELALAA